MADEQAQDLEKLIAAQVAKAVAAALPGKDGPQGVAEDPLPPPERTGPAGEFSVSLDFASEPETWAKLLKMKRLEQEFTGADRSFEYICLKAVKEWINETLQDAESRLAQQRKGNGDYEFIRF